MTIEEQEPFGFDVRILTDLRDVFIKHGIEPRKGLCIMAYLMGWEAGHAGWDGEEVSHNITVNYERGINAYCEEYEQDLLRGAIVEGSA